MQRARAPIAATLLLVLAACGDQRDPAGPGASEPAAIIFDGSRNDEADDFFFLPPIMPNPSNHDNFDAGKFNGGLRPTVSICQLEADPKASPMTDCDVSTGAPILIADFPSSAVSVSTTNEHYQVSWHTDDSPVLVDKFYRIQVFLGSIRVGFADIDPVSSARELKSTQTNEVIPLVDGRTLPIKFRIEQGVLCENKLDCGEFTVTDAGGTFLTNTKYAGVQFGPDFLPPGVDQITLTIERVPVGIDNQCHAASNSRLWKQWEACYSFTTDPDLTLLGGIRAPATVGKCTELSTDDPLYDKQLGYKSHDGEGLVALPNVSLPVTFGLDCEGFLGTGAITQSSNPVLRLAQAGWRSVGKQVGRVFGVRPAYAIDLGLGDRVRVGDGFSQINWGIGLDGSIASGGEQSVGFGLAGAPLELLLEYSHIHTHATDGEEEYESHVERMGGVPVVFEVTTGNGFFGRDIEGNPIRETTVMTSAAELNLGIASIAFTADPNGVDNVVRATAPTLSGAPFNFFIEGLPPDLVIDNLTRSVTEPTSSTALTWTYRVRNTGQGLAQPFSVSFTVQAEGEEGEAVVTRSSVVPHLGPGESVTLSETEVGPLGAGAFTVLVTADPAGTHVEASEGNNVATETFSVTDPADLSLEIVEVQPADPTTADATRFIIAVRNLGSTATPATTAVLDLDADVADQIFNVPALDPGSTATLIGPLVTIPTGGEYIARGMLDPTNAIPETNETNNAATFGYFVSPPPDLQVTSIALAQGFVHQPGNVVQYVLTVANAGPGRSRPGVARYTIGPAAPEFVFMPAVDPEQSVAVIVAGTVPATSYTVSVDVDATEAIGEVNEANNSLATPFTVAGSIIARVINDASEAGIPGATVNLVGPSGAPVGTFTSDANGEVQMNQLPPGEYTYSASAEGFGGAAGTIPVLAGVVTRPIIPLTARGFIAGTVMDAVTSAPLAGALVSIIGTTSGSVTNSVGRYGMSNLGPGTYTVNAALIGYQSVQRTVTLDAGETLIEDFALVPIPPMIAVMGNTALTYFQNGTIAAGFTVQNAGGGSLGALAAGPVLQCADVSCTGLSADTWLLSQFIQSSSTITIGNSVPLSQIPVGTYYFQVNVTAASANNSPFAHRFSVTIMAPPLTPPGGDGGVGTVVPPQDGVHD